MEATPAFDPELLELIRCPEAVHYTDHGADPGRLTLVRECWLVCANSGYKYPIIKGIPVLLSDEGAKWKDTPVELAACAASRCVNGAFSAPQLLNGANLRYTPK